MQTPSSLLATPNQTAVGSISLNYSNNAHNILMNSANDKIF
jgi:hypothetical protein